MTGLEPNAEAALLQCVALHQYPLMSLHTAMDLALHTARAAAAREEVPVGAIVLAPDGTVLAAAGNEVEARHDASAHAELLALRAAAALRGQSRLPGCDLVVTLEPCPMCAQAISLFRIRRLIFGAYDPKGGGVEHGARVLDAASCHHRPEIIGGVRETEAAALLKSFFASRRVEPD
jgi:tRNA(adenine34) deaminase